MSDRFENSRHIKWAKAVKKKYEYRCCVCGIEGGILHSHHMNSYDWCEDQRFDTDNGVVLCKFHHNKFHETYGYGNNTYKQFCEYKEISKVLIEIIKKDL